MDFLVCSSALPKSDFKSPFGELGEACNGGTVWRARDGDVFKGKGEVGAGAQEERVRQEEGVALIGVGRTWAGGSGAELSFAEAEKPAVK